MPGRRPRVGLGTCRALPAGSLSKWLRHFGWGDGADHFRPAGGGPAGRGCAVMATRRPESRTGAEPADKDPQAGRGVGLYLELSEIRIY